jgi:transcription initiation factor IIE alpha subunit
MNDKYTIPPCRFPIKEKLFDQAIEFLKKTNKPTYMGEIACELNISLAEVREIVLKLVSDDIIRAVTQEEKKERLLVPESLMYVFMKSQLHL